MTRGYPALLTQCLRPGHHCCESLQPSCLWASCCGMSAQSTWHQMELDEGVCRCVRMEAAAMRALALYKQRFLVQLAPAARAAADFSRPAFIAAAFYLAARKVGASEDLGSLCLFASCCIAGYTMYLALVPGSGQCCSGKCCTHIASNTLRLLTAGKAQGGPCSAAAAALHQRRRVCQCHVVDGRPVL